MSDLLKSVIANIENTKDRSLTEVARYEYANTAISMLNSLGENARRQLEIGILQDNLIKMGFNRFGLMEFILIDDNGNQVVAIDFMQTTVTLQPYSKPIYLFNYFSPNWQQDVLDKLKGLINEQ